VRWEGLEFLLQPTRPEVKGQAVAAVAGNGSCTFANCVFTLDPGDFDARLAVAELAAPGDAMRMESPPPREAPELRFEGCFVRGKGTFVAERASRPLRLDVENCFVALAGSFLTVDGGKDA